jgi:hypothetical protein
MVFHCSPWILHHRTCNFLMNDQTRYLFIIVVNDEPGIMEPGHCFTIEVGSGFGFLPGTLSDLFDSLRSFKVETRGGGYFQMAGQPRPKCVTFLTFELPKAHLTLNFGLELRSKCPGRAHDPHHRKWGGRAYTLMRTLLYTCTGTTFQNKEKGYRKKRITMRREKRNRR